MTKKTLLKLSWKFNFLTYWLENVARRRKPPPPFSTKVKAREERSQMQPTHSVIPRHPHNPASQTHHEERHNANLTVSSAMKNKPSKILPRCIFCPKNKTNQHTLEREATNNAGNDRTATLHATKPTYRDNVQPKHTTYIQSQHSGADPGIFVRGGSNFPKIFEKQKKKK